MDMSLTIEKFEKLPKINSSKESSNLKNDCIVPFIENKNEKLDEEKQKKFNNNCLPDDLLMALKQAEQPKEYLGPPTKRNPLGIRPIIPSIVKRPDNAWNYEKQREKFKFLTEQPVCSCGAGKDISFIYDCIVHKPENKGQPPSKYDLSAIRAGESIKDQPIKIDDSIVPDEYRIVKNQGVWPLKIDESQFSTMPDDHLNHLTVFPSLKPTGRNEVIQLKHTMDALLKRVGADVIDQKGPTQLHNLLEIIKKEQDIYNIVFHEVIRQVTVECKERGEILGKLRERYANLLSRVPREIKGLHEEIIAQRTLDRKLTEELLLFKSTIQSLTDELMQVKEHDKRIGDQANIYQRDLHRALEEAKSNASLLKEYHELYELQRKRLEKNIQILTEERELWIKAAYSISYKVANENGLNTSKRLNIAEKTWAKLAQYFSLMIADIDTNDLIEVRKSIEEWKQTSEELKIDAMDVETEIRTTLTSTQNEIENLKKILQNGVFDANGALLKLPDVKRLHLVHGQVKKIHQLVNKEAEKLTGEAVILSEDKIKKGEKNLQMLTQLCNRIRIRHNQPKEQAKQDQLDKFDNIDKDIKLLHQQYRNRATGDNGLSKHVINLNNSLDLWRRNLYTQILLSEDESKVTKTKMTEPDWIILYQTIDEWKDHTNKAFKRIGMLVKEVGEVAQLAADMIQPKEDVQKPAPVKQPERIVDHDEISNQLYQWLSVFIHYIDSQNAFDIEQINVYHNEMIHWMIQALIRLAPDKDDLSEESMRVVYEATESIDDLQKTAQNLSEKILELTESLTNRSSSIVSGEQDSSTAELENENLKNLKRSCEEWIMISKLVIGELNQRVKSSTSTYDRSSLYSSKSKKRYKTISRESIVTTELQPPNEAPEIDQIVEIKASKSVSFVQDRREETELDEIEERQEKVEETEESGENEETQSQSTEVKEDDKASESQDNDTEPVQPQENYLEKQEANIQTGQDHDPEPDIKEVVEKEPEPFEFIAHDTNTQRKFLENINLEKRTDHLNDDELKATVFNAFNTIEGLQKNLFETEERAQSSESKVAELELKLKEALEKIRALEKNANTTN